MLFSKPGQFWRVLMTWRCVAMGGGAVSLTNDNAAELEGCAQLWIESTSLSYWMPTGRCSIRNIRMLNGS